MPDPLGPGGEWDGSSLLVVSGALKLVTIQEANEWVPFLDSASYAIWTNLGTMSQDGYGMIRDYHGTVQNVEDYKNLLVRKQYTLHEENLGNK